MVRCFQIGYFGVLRMEREGKVLRKLGNLKFPGDA